MSLTRTPSAFRRLSCRKGRLSCTFPATSVLELRREKGLFGHTISQGRAPFVFCSIGIPEHDTEGRVITLEYPEYYLVTVYAQRQGGPFQTRIQGKVGDAFREYLGLRVIKPVIFCGDLNVAHKEIDLKNPKANRGKAGFTDEEREKFTELLEAGFTDTFRYFYPDLEGVYSWWSYRFNARKNNAGWRIDYFVTSEELNERLQHAAIHMDIFGSDHCPVS